MTVCNLKQKYADNYITRAEKKGLAIYRENRRRSYLDNYNKVKKRRRAWFCITKRREKGLDNQTTYNDVFLHVHSYKKAMVSVGII